MTYYKQTVGGYIVAIGTSDGSASGEITESEYNGISALLAAKPDAPAGFVYRLTDALSWALEALPETVSDDRYTLADLESKSNAELRLILTKLGLALALTKSNMVRLILAAQEGGDTDGWNSIP